MVDQKVSNYEGILQLLETSRSQQRGLVILAEDVEGEALTTLIINRLRINAKVVAVKAPGFGDNRKQNLQDLATFTGATLITELGDVKLADVTPEACGSCKKVGKGR